MSKHDELLVCIDYMFTLVHVVAGNWGSWLPWSPCSETCGKGMQSRVRLCNNPPPAFDGLQCEGSDTQTQVCKERPCPGENSRTVFKSESLREISVHIHVCSLI